MASRMCSEWGLVPNCQGSLEGKSAQAKTCSVACRQHRARRLRAANVDATALEATAGVRELVRAGGQDAVQQVLKQELAPLVREAIDDEVLRAIDQMVKLTSRAVQVLADDMEAEDAVMRQRAAALVVKYTIGHDKLVKSTDEAPPSLEVHFNLPRPDGEPEGPRYDEEGDVVAEERECDTCHAVKPTGVFVAGSDRCRACFDRLKAQVMEGL